MTDLTVHVNKDINAPIGKVFDAWLDPKILAKFMTPMPNMPDSKVESDVREGGSFTITMYAGESELPHSGKYIKINRPKQLVFSWISHCSVDNSIVTLDFTEVDDDKTNISLTHIKFLDENTRLDHEGGWTGILSKLGEVIDA